MLKKSKPSKTCTSLRLKIIKLILSRSKTPITKTTYFLVNSKISTQANVKLNVNYLAIDSVECSHH